MKFNLDSLCKTITKPWTPVDVAVCDDKVLRVALFEGEYHKHSHEYDEFFMVHRGAITIWTEKGTIELEEGEGYTVPKNTKHKPSAKTPSYVLMVDSEADK
ncbi:MAG: cupin domain-containing protein [Patescibacteria group bacterium]|nr:cupin domain-containing protein [Patescibacteria group bacterium]